MDPLWTQKFVVVGSITNDLIDLFTDLLPENSCLKDLDSFDFHILYFEANLPKQVFARA